MSRNTMGIAAGCVGAVLSGLGIAQGLSSRGHHVAVVPIVLFVLAAVSTAYLVYRRRFPAAQALREKGVDAAFWGRMKVQVYAVLVLGTAGYLYLIWLALVHAFRDHQPLALLLIPVSLWALPRFLPAFRKVRGATVEDFQEKLAERESGPQETWDGPPPTWSAWSKEGEAPNQQ